MADEPTIEVTVEAPPAPDEAPDRDPIDVRIDALAAHCAGLEGRLAHVESMAHNHEGGPGHALDVAHEAQAAAEQAAEVATVAIVESVEAAAAQAAAEEVAEEAAEEAEMAEEEEMPVLEMEPDEAPRATHWMHRPLFRR